MSMVNEKQPFALRCAVLYCFQCYLHKNPLGQKDVMQTLFPDDSNAGKKIQMSNNIESVRDNTFSDLNVN